jgi:hypothetical protein
MSESLLVGPDSAELFSGPKVITVNSDGFAAIRLGAGQHTITLTSEAPFLLAVVPTSEANP